MTVTGRAPVIGVPAMLEPVTTITSVSSSAGGGASASWAFATCENRTVELSKMSLETRPTVIALSPA